MSVDALRDHDYCSYILKSNAPTSAFSSSLPPHASAATPKPLKWLLNFIQNVYDTRLKTMDTSPSSFDSASSSVPDLCKAVLSKSSPLPLARSGRELISSIKRFVPAHPEVGLFSAFLSESIPIEHFNYFIELRHSLCLQLDQRRHSSINHPYLIDPSMSIEQTLILLSSIHVPSSEWRTILMQALGDFLSRSVLRDCCAILRKHVFFALVDSDGKRVVQRLHCCV
ncbi:hypothetical protein GEMRC1_008561 [Eukaryota sp. GEM-RC1]